MNTKVLVAFALILAATRQAHGELVCKTEQLKKPAPTLAEVYVLAEQHAKTWKADAVVAQIGNTSLGFLQPDGSAASWHLIFYSESSKSIVAIDTARGWLTCSADSGRGGRIPDLKPDFVRDGAKLYAIAKQHGVTFLSAGYGVTIGIAAAPGTRHATWNINYQQEGGKDAGVLVLVDANTGVLEKVIK